MPSYTELGKHLGVSKPRICQLTKLGMPVHSLAAAERWRQTHTISRAPTNGKRMLVKATPKKPGRPRRIVRLPSSGDTMLDTLNAVIFSRQTALGISPCD